MHLAVPPTATSARRRAWAVPFLAVLMAMALVIGACSSRAEEASTAVPVAPPPAGITAVPGVTPDGPRAPVASPSAATSGPIQSGTVLTLVEGASEARYRAREVLAGFSVSSDAVGATRAVSGRFVLDSQGVIDQEASAMTIDLRRLKSDDNRRDDFIQRSTLQTSRFPTATFIPREATGLPWPLPETGTMSFRTTADLTVHGTTKSTAWEVTAQLASSEVMGRATTAVRLQDFGMTPPRVPLVLSIEDVLKLEFDFQATRTSI